MALSLGCLRLESLAYPRTEKLGYRLITDWGKEVVRKADMMQEATSSVDLIRAGIPAHRDIWVPLETGIRTEPVERHWVECWRLVAAARLRVAVCLEAIVRLTAVADLESLS